MLIFALMLWLCRSGIIYCFVVDLFKKIFNNSSDYKHFKRRLKSHLPFTDIIRSSPYSPRWQDMG